MGVQFNFNLDGKRGLAVLVTCDYEGEMSAHTDAAEMRQTFEQFEYDIVSLANGAVTKPAIESLVSELSGYMKRYTGDTHNADESVKAIVFYFSGHGTDGDRIITSDQNLLYLGKIVKPLVTHESIGDTCDKIPKLFMIDACRGNRELGRKSTDIDIPKDSRLTQIVGNFRMEFATTEGYLAYTGCTTWSRLVARMLREHDDIYQAVMSMARQRSFQELHMQRSQMIDQLTVGPFKLYYRKGKHNMHLSVVNCPKCIQIWIVHYS